MHIIVAVLARQSLIFQFCNIIFVYYLHFYIPVNKIYISCESVMLRVCIKYPLQAAVKTALKINDPCFAMNIYEEAGDVFFKGHRNRLAAISFFQVCTTITSQHV